MNKGQEKKIAMSLGLSEFLLAKFQECEKLATSNGEVAECILQKAVSLITVSFCNKMPTCKQGPVFSQLMSLLITF